jgi:hypothetical protein
MSDGASVYVHDGDERGVYLYTYWYGPELPDMVWKALARRQRWNDDAYLARIIFNTMTKGREDAEIGFGISAYEIGANYVIDVDTAAQQVTVGDEPVQSFRDFIHAARTGGAR